MKYTIAILLGFFISQVNAQRADTVFDLKSVSRTLSIRVHSTDTLLLRDSNRYGDFRTDTVVLDSTITIDHVLNYLGRWGVDTTRTYAGMIRYLRDSLGLAAATKPIVFDPPHFHESTPLPSTQPSPAQSTSSTSSTSSSWINHVVAALVGLIGGFVFFVLLVEYRKRKRKKETVALDDRSGNGGAGSADVTQPTTAEQEVLKLEWAADVLTALKKRGLVPGKKNAHNDLAQKLLGLIEKLEEEKNGVEINLQKVGQDMKKQIETLEASNNQFSKQQSQHLEAIKVLTTENAGLQESLDSEKKAAAQDNEMILKALSWLKEVRGSITEAINGGDENAANKRIVAGSINSFLLLSSYLDFRRKAAGESGQSASPKKIDPDTNLRILMGERVELKQPGPNLSDAPPLAGQLRDLVREQGISDISPFGYEGHKIKP